MNIKNLMNKRVSDSNYDFTDMEIKKVIAGVYKIERQPNGIIVYTENAFTSLTKLNALKGIFGVSDIEVDVRYDRTHGLIYTLIK